MTKERTTEDTQKSEKTRNEITDRLANLFRTKDTDGFVELRGWIQKLEKAMDSGEHSIVPAFDDACKEEYNDNALEKFMKILRLSFCT